MVIFAVVVIGGSALLIHRERRGSNQVWKQTLVGLVAILLLGWLAWFAATGELTLPLLRTGFRMVAFSIIIMVVVLFFRQGMLGDKEFSDILFARRRNAGKEATK